jgi:hypothetical protein
MLTAVATPATKTYDATGFDQTTFKVTSIDWAYTDTDAANRLGGTLGWSIAPAQGNSNSYPGAGTYVLTPSGLTSSDYSVSFATATLTIDKATPTVTATGGTFTYAPNTPRAGTGSATGIGGAALPFTLSYTEGATVLPGAPMDAGSYTVTATFAGDLNYNTASASDAITINKAAATIELSNLLFQYSLNTPRTPTVTTNPLGLQTVTVTYSVNGSTPTLTAPSAVGVYRIEATLVNRNYEGSESGYLVIYDPSAGFVTGGGWIKYSGASCRLAACAGLGGQADFGFVSKYLKGANVPTGNTRFEFHAGTLAFASTSYEWLVVGGGRAQFKGVGKINGQGDYGFLLTAVDGTTDKFRIKIWDRAAGGSEDDTVFDNGSEASLDKVNGNGSIVVHSAK